MKKVIETVVIKVQENIEIPSRSVRVEKNISLKEAGKKYLDFVSPTVRKSSIKMSDSKDLVVKSDIR